MHARCTNFAVNIVIDSLRVFLKLPVVEYRANLYTRLTMAKRRKERKSRHDIKEMRPAIIIKRLDQRKVTLLAMLFDFD